MRNFQAGNEMILNFKKQHAERISQEDCRIKKKKASMKTKPTHALSCFLDSCKLRDLSDIPTILADYTFDIMMSLTKLIPRQQYFIVLTDN